MAICPFHQEKTPSLSIDPARGLFNCFGCGKSGDVFRWVEETQGAGFADAVELLARRAGVTLTVDPAADRNRGKREKLVAATKAAVEFYHDRLRTADDAGGARSYLRGRGYENELVVKFQLGYSPATWDALTQHLVSNDIAERTVQEAGLATRARNGRLVDRFRGRLMFPIFDLRGDPVGFGARQLEGDGPKYLNTAETPIYRKSQLLYGLNWAKGEIVRSHEAVVVEGYTDVIAFQQAGSPTAVATCGTALGASHLDLLRRFTERVVLAFDADEAGAGAALRGFEVAVPGDLDLRVAALPMGKDPADLIRDGETELLTKSVSESLPLLQFRLEQELDRFDLNEAEARGRAVRATAAIVAQHPDELVRHEYAVLLSRRTGMDLPLVLKAVAGAARAGRTAAASRPRPADVEDQVLSGVQKTERELLRLLLANDPSVRAEEVREEFFADEGYSDAFAKIAPTILALDPGVPPDLGSLIGEDDSPIGTMLRELALVDRPLADAGQVINRLKVGAVERRIEQMRPRLEQLDPERDSEEYSAAFGELIALERQRRELWSQE